MIYLKSNSGIGGAIILNGTVVEGAHRLAGAFGHVPLVPDGEPCGCGQRGCLVTVAGPDAVLHAAGLGPLLAAGGLEAALDELTDRVLAGEPLALAAWDGAAGWIARALQILAMSIDPQAIVLGGYWARLADSVARAFCRHPARDVARCGADGDRRGGGPAGRRCRAAGRGLERPGQAAAGSAPDFHIVQPLNY